MGRVTRAAARADPVLADETVTLAEHAIAEDTTVVNIDNYQEGGEMPAPSAAAASSSARAPLEEITSSSERLNHPAPVNADFHNPPTADTEPAVTLVETASDSEPTSENNVILLFGTETKPDPRPSKESRPTISPSRPNSKKSTKKQNSAIKITVEESPYRQPLQKPQDVPLISVPSSELDHIMDNNLDISTSLASKEAAKISRQPTQKMEAPNDTAAPDDPSLPGVEKSELLKPKTLKLHPMIESVGAKPEVKAKATKRKPVASCVSKAKSSTTKASNGQSPPELNQQQTQTKAVENLTALFEQEPKGNTSGGGGTKSSLGCNETTGSLTQRPKRTSAIEQLDALEDDIEAVEKSIAKSSPKKRKAETSISDPSSTKTPQTNASVKASPIEKDGEPKPTSSFAKARTVTALNTPPKVQKSSKPTTISNFQLSSQATTARLKAQREERQKRREEEQKMTQTKSTATKPVAKPVQVRTTAASRARMSLATRDVNNSMPPTNVLSPTSASQSNAVSRLHDQYTLPGRKSCSPIKTHKTISKSKTVIGKPMCDSAVKSTTSSGLYIRPKATVANSTNRKSLPGRTHASNGLVAANVATKRSSMVMNGPQLSRSSTTGTSSTRRISSVKGKEVFNREKVEKEGQTRKIEAAKKARMEAAERGRAASKEWAEKKMRAMEARKSQASTDSTAAKLENEKVEVVAADYGDEDKENQQQIAGNGKSSKTQVANQETSNNDDHTSNNRSLAVNILIGDTASQEDAAYILAEMKRIDKVTNNVDGSQKINPEVDAAGP